MNCDLWKPAIASEFFHYLPELAKTHKRAVLYPRISSGPIEQAKKHETILRKLVKQLAPDVLIINSFPCIESSDIRKYRPKLEEMVEYCLKNDAFTIAIVRDRDLRHGEFFKTGTEPPTVEECKTYTEKMNGVKSALCYNPDNTPKQNDSIRIMLGLEESDKKSGRRFKKCKPFKRKWQQTVVDTYFRLLSTRKTAEEITHRSGRTITQMTVYRWVLQSTGLTTLHR